MDGLSAAANALAVVSAADLTIKTVKELVTALRAIKEAPGKAQTFHGEIKDLTKIISLARAHASTHASNAAPTQQQQLWEQFGHELDACRTALYGMRIKVGNLSAAGRSGSFWSQLQWRASFLLSEEDLAEMISELNRRRGSLHFLLGLLTSNEQSQMSRDMSVIRSESRAMQIRMQQSMNSGSQKLATIEQHVSDMGESFRQLSLAVTKSHQSIAGGIDVPAALAPPIEALRDFISSSTSSHPLWDMVLKHLEEMMSSSSSIHATQGSGMSYSSYGIITRLTQHIYTPAPDAYHSASTEAEDKVYIEHSQQGSGTLSLQVCKLRTARSGSRAVGLLQYTPSIRARRCAYGFSLLVRLDQHNPSADSFLRNIRPFNVRPRTAEVFNLVLDGNIVGVGNLFQNGAASVVDHDEKGLGLLVYAVESVNPEMYEYLLRQGADPMETFNDDLIFSPMTALLYLVIRSAPLQIARHTSDIDTEQWAESYRKTMLSSIRYGFDLDAASDSFAASLFDFPAEFQARICKTLFSLGMDVDSEGKGFPLLLVLITKAVTSGGSLAALEVLINSGASLTCATPHLLSPLGTIFGFIGQASPPQISVEEEDDGIILCEVSSTVCHDADDEDDDDDDDDNDSKVPLTRHQHDMLEKYIRHLLSLLCLLLRAGVSKHATILEGDDMSVSEYVEWCPFTEWLWYVCTRDYDLPHSGEAAQHQYDSPVLCLAGGRKSVLDKSITLQVSQGFLRKFTWWRLNPAFDDESQRLPNRAHELQGPGRSDNDGFAEDEIIYTDHGVSAAANVTYETDSSSEYEMEDDDDDG